MDDVKLGDIRAAIAACSFIEEGSTQESRQRANRERINLYAKLDEYGSKLDELREVASRENKSTTDIEALRAEVESSAATLVIRPVQPNPWPILRFMDFLWRAPATFLFTMYMAFVVSVPLIALTMVEQQCSLLWNRFRKPSAGGARAKRDGVGSKGNSSGIGGNSNGTISGSGSGSSNGNNKNGNSDKCNNNGSSSSSGTCNGADDSSITNGNCKSSSSNGTSKRSGVTGAAIFRKSSAAAAPFDDASSKPTAPGPSVAAAAAAAAPASADAIFDSGSNCGSCGGGVSSLIKRMNARWLLLLMGVSVRTEGMRDSCLSRPAMLLFSHVSTLDAMIILGTFPRALCAVVKEELFALPFVGWIMASHGGIPINRRNRASAVQALAEAGERARQLQLFVAMAPEGTRSKTGQLGPFKKGALHMQEQLQWPVVPVTIRGACELFPLKSYFNQCGKVVLQFHKPIEAQEIKSRDGLSRRLRQEMLEAVQKEVPEAGCPLGPTRRAGNILATGFTYWAASVASKMAIKFCRREEVSMWAVGAWAFAYVVVSTAFVYFVYARKCFSSRCVARDGVRGAGGGGKGEGLVSKGSGGGDGSEEVEESSELSRLLRQDSGETTVATPTQGKDR